MKVFNQNHEGFFSDKPSEIPLQCFSVSSKVGAVMQLDFEKGEKFSIRNGSSSQYPSIHLYLQSRIVKW